MEDYADYLNLREPDSGVEMTLASAMTSTGMIDRVVEDEEHNKRSKKRALLQ